MLGKYLFSGASQVLGCGFWASPQDILYPVDMNHDTFVAENPEMFSLPPDAVPSVDAALDSGWARVRLHSNGVEIDLASRGVAHSTESRVKAILEALVAKGNSFTGKNIHVGVDGHPGITLYFEQALSGSWDNAADWASRSNPLFMSRSGFAKALGLALGGVWISPDGVIRGTTTTHIRDVVSNPGVFGLSPEWVKSIFHQFNEGLGKEGDARDFIVGVLVANGWIRIRWYASDATYRIELKKLTSKNKNSLFLWASQVLARFPQKADTAVAVSEVVAGKPVSESYFVLSDLLDSTKFVSCGVSPCTGYPGVFYGGESTKGLAPQDLGPSGTINQPMFSALRVNTPVPRELAGLFGTFAPGLNEAIPVFEYINYLTDPDGVWLVVTLPEFAPLGAALHLRHEGGMCYLRVASVNGMKHGGVRRLSAHREALVNSFNRLGEFFQDHMIARGLV